MERFDTLQAYANLVEVRRKAARRNGAIVGLGYLIIVAIAAYLLNKEYAVHLDALLYPFVALNFAMLTGQQITSEIVNKSILDLIATLQRTQEGAP